MEWESDSPCCNYIHPGQGRRSLGRHSRWELEFRDCGTIPWWGLLLTAERQIEGMWGRSLWWEIPVKESQAAMEARWYSWVTCRGWSHHCSLSLSMSQHWQLKNRGTDPLNDWHTELQSRTSTRVLLYVPDEPIYRLGPQPGRSLYVPSARKNREGPQAREPSKWLNGWSYGERLTKRPSDCQLQEAQKKKKNTVRAITPAVETVCAPVHLVPPGSPLPKQLHHLHDQLSLR